MYRETTFPLVFVSILYPYLFDFCHVKLSWNDASGISIMMGAKTSDAQT